MRRLFSASTVLMLAPVPAPALAQADEATTPDSGEIVVTATRRSESIQKVPSSITALTEATIRQTGADKFEDYARTVPGLVYNQNGSNSGSFAIRGISTSTAASNTQSPVAVYYDDLPALDSYLPLATPDLRLFDIERIEVLRGPQGTLFGSGAMGGAIRVITNKPDFNEVIVKAEATAAFTEHGDPSFGANLAVNLPLAANLAARIVGYYRHDGGFVDNGARMKRNVNDQDSYAVRGTLRWEATERLTLTGTISHQNDRPEDTAFVTYGGQGYSYDSLVPIFVTNRVTTGNLAGTYDFGFATLTSSTTYSRRDNRARNDLTRALSALLGTTSPAPITDDIRSRTLVQEIRLASNGSGPFRWVIGGFYSRLRQRTHEVISIAGAGAMFAPAFPSDDIYDGTFRVRSTERALFGEVSYEIVPRLTATAGIRAFGNTVAAAAVADGVLNGGPTVDARKTEQSSQTPKFALSFQAMPDVLIYGQAAKGYRVGQNNLTPATDPTSGLPIPGSYGSDSLWNYEIGMKSSLLDRRLTANVALYYIDWSNIQLKSLSATGFSYVGNAGTARSKGIEAEFRYRPDTHVELGTSLTYNHSELRSVAPGAVAVVGDRLPGTPKFAAASFVQLGTALGGGADGYVRLAHQYSGKAFSDLNNGTALVYGDYHKFDLRIGARGQGWEAVAFIENLTNRDDYQSAFLVPFGHTAIRLKPRTFGVTLRRDF